MGEKLSTANEALENANAEQDKVRKTLENAKATAEQCKEKQFSEKDPGLKPLMKTYKPKSQWGEGWQPDSENKCTACGDPFSGLLGDKSWYHHCRWCGKLVHKKCSEERSVTIRICTECKKNVDNYEQTLSDYNASSLRLGLHEKITRMLRIP